MLRRGDHWSPAGVHRTSLRVKQIKKGHILSKNPRDVSNFFAYKYYMLQVF